MWRCPRRTCLRQVDGLLLEAFRSLLSQILEPLARAAAEDAAFSLN